MSNYKARKNLKIMPWKALLGLGSGILNGIITDHYNEKNTERNQSYWERQLGLTYNANEKAADNAMKRSLNMYNLTQSPEAMVRQLKAAGLNPALMYSNGGMGGHTTNGAQGGASGANGAPNPLGLQNFIDPITMAQIANLNADTEKKKAEAKNIVMDTEVKETVKLLNNQSLTQNERKFIEEIIILQLQQENIEQDTKTKLADKYAKDQQAEESKKRQAILENEKTMSDIELEFKKRFKDKGFDLDSMPGIASLIIQLGNKGKELLDKWLGDKWEINWPKDLKWW